MRAQATLDFMLTFLFVMVFFAMLFSALSLANRAARESAGAMAQTALMEEFARVAEVYSNSGIAMTGRTDVSYRMENWTVQSDYQGRTIVIRGIYDAPKILAEPI